MQTLKVLYTVIFMMTVAPLCFAQAEIVDSLPIGAAAGSSARNSQVAQQQANSVDANTQSELFYQLQMLQQEVQQLRGTLEEQTHEIRRLKQQQLDDYVDLDRRLSELSKGGSVPLSKRPRPSASVGGKTPRKQATDNSEDAAKKELVDYDKAVRLILKQKDLAAGAIAMQTYLKDYPNGVYVSNAQYWLGQVAFSDDNLNEAKKWFGQVLVTNPTSQKAPEAKYKLALVLHKLGEAAEAKKLLGEVAQTSSSAANLAKKFLSNNF